MNENNYNEELEELYSLTLLQEDGIVLTQLQSDRYVELYDMLFKNNIEIPFGVEI